MNLSPKQKLFCEYYVALGNATEAAKKAGYSEKTAHEIGRQNLRKLEIRNFLDELANQDKKEVASAQEVLEFFTDMMRSAKKDKDRIKAAENLAKRMGLDRAASDTASTEEKYPPVTIPAGLMKKPNAAKYELILQRFFSDLSVKATCKKWTTPKTA